MAQPREEPAGERPRGRVPEETLRTGGGGRPRQHTQGCRRPQSLGCLHSKHGKPGLETSSSVDKGWARERLNSSNTAIPCRSWVTVMTPPSPAPGARTHRAYTATSNTVRPPGPVHSNHFTIFWHDKQDTQLLRTNSRFLSLQAWGHPGLGPLPETWASSRPPGLGLDINVPPEAFADPNSGQGPSWPELLAV